MGDTEADLILHNGVIRTLVGGEVAEAIFIKDGRIMGVGGNTDLETVRCPLGQRVDLRGAAVLPGFVDSHLHLLALGLSLGAMDLRATGGPREAAEIVGRATPNLAPGEWIVGNGWDHTGWVGGLPSRHDLDPVSLDHPVLLRRKCGHVCWVNTRALDCAGIQRGVQDPVGGRIERDPVTGEPTGILCEQAISLVSRLVERPSPARTREALSAAIAEVHSHGVTGVHVMEGRESLRGCGDLRAEERLRLRVTMHVPAASLSNAAELGLRSGVGDEWLRIGGIKAFADGSLGGRTAHLLEPYEDAADMGVAVASRDELADLIRRAAAAGFGVCVHAIGDRANRDVLDALQMTRGVWGPEGIVQRIEHAQILHDEDIPRFAELGVTASMQPIHTTSDREISDRYLGDRARQAYRFRSLFSLGVRVVFGSDAPVESPRVMAGIHAAVTRRRRDGSPGPDGWYPDERITAEQALRAYTTDTGGQRVVAAGAVADLVVLSADPLGVDGEELFAIRELGTIVGGQFVWRALEG